VRNLHRYDTIYSMKTATESNGREAVVVPMVSLEEMPHVTPDERTAIVAELEQIEAEMDSGSFQTYSPEWLHQRFLEIYNRAS